MGPDGPRTAWVDCLIQHDLVDAVKDATEGRAMTAPDWWLYHRLMQDDLDFLDIIPTEGNPRELRLPLNRAAERDEIEFLRAHAISVDTRPDQEHAPATVILVRVGHAVDDLTAAVTKTVRQVERALRELAARSAERRQRDQQHRQAMTEKETIHAAVKAILAERAEAKGSV